MQREIFGTLRIVQEASSTQDLATELALRGEPDGTAVMALQQTKGRGRSGREWMSPPGKNLALSLVLRPPMGLSEVPLLGLLASVAVAETVETFGVRSAELKWPNDVLVEERKIAGILPEASTDGRSVRFVIMGIGLNVNSELADFSKDFAIPATSLVAETGVEQDLTVVAGEFLYRMGSLYERAVREGCKFIVPLWETRWAHRGQMLSSADVAGTAEGLDPDGALLLRTNQGSLARVVSGEISAIRQTCD
jgi:BirA family transcriptional regulator, biotin operon repressor / biotin---[acetyl-CoA-carboxylase] ligase